MQKPYPLTFTICFLASLSALLTAYTLEYWQNLEPCPLCMAQRILMAGVLCIAVLAYLHRSRTRFYSFLILLFSGTGFALAYRHVSLYNFPSEQLSSCSGSLGYLFKTLPLNEALTALWKGGAECTADTSRWLSLTIPEWALVSFVVISLLGLVSLIRGK